MNDRSSADRGRVSTGIADLDTILGGGVTANRAYLLEGAPGSGKTTIALQFLLEGARIGERGLYITLSETAAELTEVARSHNWKLDDIELFELVNEEGLNQDREQSILDPSEVELGETIQGVIACVDRLQPSRVVFDSLSEMKLLAQNSLRYRRQILALKQYFSTRQCTVFLLDDRSSDPGDLQLHSIAHGVITLEQAAQEYGSERRRLRVVKMRGVKYRGGFHDFAIETGGVAVFPRLVAAGHHREFTGDLALTGVERLDQMLGGGMSPGTNTLLNGPSGVGKTTTAVRCGLTALERGDKAAYYLFDEGKATMLARARSMGMDLQYHIDSGQLQISQIDPAELSPGEFANRVRRAVEHDGVRFIVIDSLNAFLQAMPGEKYLLLQMHEMLSYLNQQGVITVLILGQHGIVGEVRSEVDLSYLSDTIVLFRYFEARGSVYKALSVAKSRTNPHESSIREFLLGPTGVKIGEPLEDFEGVLSGLPNYRGKTPLMAAEPAAADA
ncbi:MAG: gas vesicle protein GvpD [Brevundimonas sp.]|uniref:ATPase domain-containing protein n=1 Tax=Brevundimonas sp. TaxID=1871086 RepID=UPI00261E0EFD|nr:ATPase domain-containing protein [Brevundimonas sp.]MDI6623199.1 gas vesicle protein GvpD [Brevundimonas sp.]MDQ7811350.1 ATPase domain-containing protein [Brevundimonas sp.]